MRTSPDPHIAGAAHDLRMQVGHDPVIDDGEQLAQKLLREGDTDLAACLKCPLTCHGSKETVAAAKLMLDTRDSLLQTIPVSPR